MKLTVDRKPWSRGVTHLMYVGDDATVDRELVTTENAKKLCKAGIGIAVLGFLVGSKTLRRVGTIAAISGYVAI